MPENLTTPEPEIQKQLDEVRAYLYSVLTGMDGTPLCPFVKGIEDRNGYVVYPQSEYVSPENLIDEVNRALDAFKIISPRETSIDQSIDYKSTAVSFHHSDNQTEEFCAALDQIRNTERRGAALQQGLMLAQMHPHHPRAFRSKTSYSAGVPMIMVRRMHRPDHIFMKTTEDKAVYESFFPDTNPMSFIHARPN